MENKLLENGNGGEGRRGGGGGGGGGRRGRPYKMEDQYFSFKVLLKVDQSRHGEAKESHFKSYHSKHRR